MKSLEVIHLRLAGVSPERLATIIRRSVDPTAGSMDVRIYRHARLETDLVVHLRRSSAAGDRVSDVGARLAALLRDYGMVEHSVWVDAEQTTSEEGR